ncbi:hypothetical protein FACS1894205_4140 [Alphaproteobacteria bacterium]|nr:hypothetical protein FACS1894205_4140 [Alphaproteobacteria bacterium]
MGLPAILCITLGKEDFILVPCPAARMIAATARFVITDPTALKRRGKCHKLEAGTIQTLFQFITDARRTLLTEALAPFMRAVFDILKTGA